MAAAGCHTPPAPIAVGNVWGVRVPPNPRPTTNVLVQPPPHPGGAVNLAPGRLVPVPTSMPSPPLRTAASAACARAAGGGRERRQRPLDGRVGWRRAGRQWTPPSPPSSSSLPPVYSTAATRIVGKGDEEEHHDCPRCRDDDRGWGRAGG